MTTDTMYVELTRMEEERDAARLQASQLLQHLTIVKNESAFFEAEATKWKRAAAIASDKYQAMKLKYESE